MDDHHLITGGCHCGNIRYRFTTTIAPDDLPLRACGCSFCSKQGAVYGSDPAGELEVETRDPDAVTRYRFATGVVDFILCRQCGVMPYALSLIEGRTYAVVNLNTADREFPADRVKRVDLSGESPEEGAARRKRAWIGTARFR